MNTRKKQDPTEAVLVITVGFLVVYLVSGQRWAAAVSVVVGLSGIFSALLTRLIALGWYKLAEILGLIVPNILLSLVFFLVLLPLAWLSRLFSKSNSLQLNAPAHSNFKDIQREYDASSFERPW